MKTGRTLQELAVELDRQRHAKKDYLADTRKLALRESRTGEPAGVMLDGINGGLPLRPIAHSQLAATLNIPKPYYDRMLKDQPDLMCHNVNTWLTTQPATKLVRTLDNEIRAILTDSYRPLDNYDLSNAVLPQLAKLDASVLSCEITDSRMYLQAVTERVSGIVANVGDVVQAGIVVSNSEIGQGSLSLEYLEYTLRCKNGMVTGSILRKIHASRASRNVELEDAREYFRTETRELDDQAFFLKVRDTCAAAFEQTRFEQRINKLSAATLQAIAAPTVVECVELTAKRMNLSEGEKDNVLAHLIQGGQLNQYGLANAITRAAQDVDDYDRSIELQSIGNNVIELSQKDWKALAV